MKVLRVSFVGVRTTAFEATEALFRDVLGMEPAFANPGWAGFRLPSGERDLLEIFGQADVDTRVVPPEFEHGALIALAVEDIATAREELAAAGLELLGDLVWAADLTGNVADVGWGWCFFRASDGNVYALQQDGLRGRAGDPTPM